ncbi:MAG: DUF1843 domain-containing protein [Rhodospirillales bacterium]|nr:DUF1843 domain-containing protein [Rhodospirillales bacterium]
MVIVMYGTAIRNAIASGNLTRMKATLKRARDLMRKQGNLGAAITMLQREIAKTTKAKKTRKTRRTTKRR